MSAPAPTRKGGTINLTLGLLTIPLDKFSSTQESAVSRSQYRRVPVMIPATDAKGKVITDAEGHTVMVQKEEEIDGVMTPVTELHAVGMTSYDKVTGENVNKGDIIKCVESSDGTLVEVSDEELQAFQSENGDCEFLGFVKYADFEDKYVVEKAYQVRPSKPKGPNGKTSTKASPYNKPFMVILEGMKQEGAVALLKVVERGTPRPYALLADGTLYSLRYEEEVRETLPMPIVEFTDAEAKQGVALVKKNILKTPPVLEDTLSNTVAEFVEAKAAAMAKGEAVVLPEAAEVTTADEGTDLMALLGASL